MLSRALPILLALSLGCSACAGGQKHNEWDDIDYTGVYKRAEKRESDSSYKLPPTVRGCVDDDLYNCK